VLQCFAGCHSRDLLLIVGQSYASPAGYARFTLGPSVGSAVGTGPEADVPEATRMMWWTTPPGIECAKG
jgi:hypothetical protein